MGPVVLSLGLAYARLCPPNLVGQARKLVLIVRHHPLSMNQNNIDSMPSKHRVVI